MPFWRVTLHIFLGNREPSGTLGNYREDDWHPPLGQPITDVGMVPLTINPIYTLYHVGICWGPYPLLNGSLWRKKKLGALHMKSFPTIFPMGLVVNGVKWGYGAPMGGAIFAYLESRAHGQSWSGLDEVLDHMRRMGRKEYWSHSCWQIFHIWILWVRIKCSFYLHLC